MYNSKIILFLIVFFIQFSIFSQDPTELVRIHSVSSVADMNAIGGTADPVLEGSLIYVSSTEKLYHYSAISGWLEHGTITTSTILVDQSFVWAGNVNDPDIHLDNNPLTLLETRADTGWTFTNPNTVTYTGSPDHVEIDLMAVVNSTGQYYAQPHIRVYRNGDEIGEGAARFFTNNRSYSGRKTVVISMIDPNPGANPVYTFVTFEDDNRTMNDPTIVDLSPVSLVAIEKVEVLQTITNN